MDGVVGQPDPEFDEAPESLVLQVYVRWTAHTNSDRSSFDRCNL